MNSSLDLLHLATAAAEAAGGLIRSARRPGEWQRKGHNDWVTEVDREAERVIQQILLEGTPGSRVLGEELSPEGASDGLVWVVDPLDGTTNFLHGYPQYAVSIAAAIDGELRAGVILDVPRDCRYGAVRGGGAWMGESRLQVSGVAEPARALLGTGYPFKRLDSLDRYLDQFRRILPVTSGVRRAGSAALDLADVAAGRLDAFWELSLAPWDFAAGTLLVREAGGVVTDLQGNPAGVEHSGIVAGNATMHGWLLGQVNEGT